MPWIWIGKVEAPEKVFSMFPFSIRFRTWYLTWPFKKFKFISKIKNDRGYEEDIIETISPKWFWGYINREYDFYGYDKNVEFVIKVGYDE